MDVTHRGRVGSPTCTLPPTAPRVKPEAVDPASTGYDPADVAALRERARAAAAAAAPTPDAGVILAELPRAEGVTLRLTASTYRGSREGHYAELALWRGARRVPGRGIVLRYAELGAVAEALCDAADEIAQRRAGDAWEGL